MRGLQITLPVLHKPRRDSMSGGCRFNAGQPGPDGSPMPFLHPEALQQGYQPWYKALAPASLPEAATLYAAHVATGAAAAAGAPLPTQPPQQKSKNAGKKEAKAATPAPAAAAAVPMGGCAASPSSELLPLVTPAGRCSSIAPPCVAFSGGKVSVSEGTQILLQESFTLEMLVRPDVRSSSDTPQALWRYCSGPGGVCLSLVDGHTLRLDVQGVGTATAKVRV